MPRNILEYLEETVLRLPDKKVFLGEKSALSFRQVYDQARSIGTLLHHRGICRRAVVVFMERSAETVTAFLGAVYGGCFYVPLDEQMPRHRIELILNSLDPGLLICDESTQETALGLLPRDKVISYSRAAFGIIDEGALADIRRRQLDVDPIYTVFTSGSTGIPKGVMGCHRSAIDYIEHLCPVLGFGEHTVFGNQTPLYFDACLKEILPALKLGGSVWLIPRQLFKFPVRLVEYLNDKKINTLCWVVSALTFVSSLGTFGTVRPRYLTTVAFASEVFPIRQLNLWRKAAPRARFFNLYGPTEATGICCYYEVTRQFSESEVLPIGQPFPNTEILLLREDNTEAPAGEAGEICIRGTRLTLGYYGEPEKTKTAFVQNPLNPYYPERIYRTGDLGKYNERGELLFLSRKDSQIKHMGHRIELGEIEAAANTLPGLRSACCTFSDNRLRLYYEGSADPETVMAHLRQRLPRYMLPHNVLRLDAMPLTPNGKIDRNLLKSQKGATP